MQDEKVREAVKRLRLSIKNEDGSTLSQTDFGRLIGKSLNTIQRYEGVVAPKGTVLWDLRALATEHKEIELALIFEDAGFESKDRLWIKEVAQIWSLTRKALEQHRRGESVEFVDVLENIKAICVEINPLVQWAYKGVPGAPIYQAAKRGEASYLAAHRKRVEEKKKPK